MKKILSLILIIMLVLIPAAQAGTFLDVDDSYSWAIDAIKELNDKEIIKGYPDGSFKPQNNITNAETAKIVVLYFGESDNDVTYNDVNKDEWFYSYVKKSKNYFLRDIRDKNFRPQNNALRKEIAYALYIGAGYDKIDESLPINEKYARAVSYLNERGILKGYPDGTLGEEKEVTRAEFAVLIKRVNDLKNVPEIKEEEKPQENLSAYPRPHTYFYVVTDVVTALSEDGEAIQKICGYVNGEYEENFIPDDAEINNLLSLEDRIEKNDIIYIFKDYYGKIMYVTILVNAEKLKNANSYDSFNIYNSKHNKYVFGKVQRIINENVIEIIKNKDAEILEAYRVKDDATFYIFEDEKISLSKLTKIKEDRKRGDGDFIFTFIVDEEIKDVLIIR